MNKSDDIKELAIALSMAQMHMKPAEMNAENPYFKTKYADFGAIVAVAREPLSTNGLSFTQLVSCIEGRVGVETILMHTSGQWISTLIDLPLPEKVGGRSMAQEAGSILTYLRRYSLAAILGIYADTDTDGNEKKDSAKKETTSQQKEDLNKSEKNPTMSIETAMGVTSSDGTTYSSLSDKDLNGRLIGLRKKLAANGLTTEEKEQYQYKLSAAVTIVNERAKAKKEGER